MAYEYSPINIDALQAEVRYHDIVEGVFEIGSVRVTSHYLHHPALTLGFRFEADGACVVYACDHEPHSLYPLDAAPGTPPIHHEDRRHVEFLSGADLVIHDAQYIMDDFPGKLGWGHTPLERAVDYAILARTRHLVFTHHDPERDDDAVDALCELARERASGAEHVPEISGAREGPVIDIVGDRRRSLLTGSEPSPFPSREPRKAATVLIVDDDPDMVLLLETALRADGVRVLSAGDGDRALELARAELPTLILLDMQLPGRDGMEVCRTLRGEQDARLSDVPILVLTGMKLQEADLVAAFVAGATDFLTKPIKPTLVRSCVRSWLLRTVPN
jgi:CheY-like chemotaxis protein